MSGCIDDITFQLESINKRNQGSQTRKFNALINLGHLYVNRNITYFLSLKEIRNKSCCTGSKANFVNHQ